MALEAPDEAALEAPGEAAAEAPGSADVVFRDQGVTVVVRRHDLEIIGDFAIEYWGLPGAGILDARALGGGTCASRS